MITDQQIIYDALRIYAKHRQTFCEFVHKEDSESLEGKPFTDIEKADALKIAKQCSRLTDIAAQVLQDQQSPIIIPGK
jgi:hypothetical protein